MQEQAPEHVHAGIIWTPRMRERLELLSLYRPTPPWVEGNAHSATHVAPVQHSAVPCLFKYDPEAFIALSAVLHDLLSDDSACSPSWRDVLARRRASESYADPFPVDGEAGLRCDLLLRVMRVMVDKPDREWQRMESPLDCHRTGAFSCHSEAKCGYNLRPATGDGHDDDKVNERVVLGPTFFATLIDYLRTVGQIECSVENGDLINHPASVPGADGAIYPYPFADTSDDVENQKRLLCQVPTAPAFGISHSPLSDTPVSSPYTAILEAIESEGSAINLIVRSGHAEELIPTWLGTWMGDHSALGKVWCGVTRAGIPVGNFNDDDKAHIIAMFGLLHKIGVIHGDILMANMCRIPLSPLALPLSSPLSPGEQQQQPVQLIDFGCAVLRPSISRKGQSGDVVDTGAGLRDRYADMSRVWGERASAEKQKVRALLGKV